MSADFDSTEVAVIGGGPAGCAAAIVLARAGVEVTLLERERVSAHKVCGEFLSGEALKYLKQLGLDLRNLGAVPLTSVRLTKSRTVAECELPFAALSLTRRRLDSHLLALAESAGVRVLRGSQVEGLERAGDRWFVLHGRQTLQANTIFLATGKHNLRGYPRQPGSQPSLVAFKMYFRLSATEQQALNNCVELVTYRGGYAGLQPVEDSRANLCCLIQKETLRQVGGTWPLLRNYLTAQSAHLRQRLDGAEALLEKPLTIAPIPYGFVRQSSASGIWFLGDQAAVIPSFTGDGISLALHSGLLAARYYLQGKTASAYQQAFAGQVGRQVALATGVSKALVQVPRVATLLPALWPGVMKLLAQQTRIRPDCLLHRRASVALHTS